MKNSGQFTFQFIKIRKQKPVIIIVICVLFFSSAHSLSPPSIEELKTGQGQEEQLPWLRDPVYLQQKYIDHKMFAVFPAEDLKELLAKAEDITGISLANASGKIVVGGFSNTEEHLVETARFMKSAEIIGIEWDPHSCNEARKKIDDYDPEIVSRIKIECADLRNLRGCIKDNSVTVFLLHMVLDLWKEDEGSLKRILSEVSRVLAPNGLLIAGSEGLAFSKVILETQHNMIDIAPDKNDILIYFNNRKGNGAVNWEQMRVKKDNEKQSASESKGPDNSFLPVNQIDPEMAEKIITSALNFKAGNPFHIKSITDELNLKPEIVRGVLLGNGFADIAGKTGYM
ncbi:MAG: class I SAM-dependent methyltransferase, partial [bacterium]